MLHLKVKHLLETVGSPLSVICSSHSHTMQVLHLSEHCQDR